MSNSRLSSSVWTISLGWIFALGSVALVNFNAKLFPLIFFIDVWFFSHPHAISTFFKQSTLERFSKLGLFLLFLCILFILGTTSYYFGTVVLFKIYFYWQWFHYLRQNYGIAQTSELKYRQVEAMFLHFMPAIALLALAAKGPLGFLGYYISFPEIPFTADFLNALYLACFAGWGLFQIFFFLRKDFNSHTFLNCLSAFLLYYMVYIHSENFLLGWLGMTFYHNLQYIIFNWSKKKFSLAFFENKNLWWFYFFMTVVSIFFYGAMTSLQVFISSPFIPIGLVMIFSVNILHYICDSVVWRGISRQGAKD